MISRCLFLLGITIFLQPSNGGWIGKQMEFYVSPLLKHITASNENLKTTIVEIKTKTKEVKEQNKQLMEKVNKIPTKCQDKELQKKVQIFESWNFDSCVNLTDDMKIASDLAMQGGIFTFIITETVSRLGKNLLDCLNGVYSQMFACINKNLKTMKSSIELFKNNTVPIVHNSTIVARDMRIDFDCCIGIPVTLRNQIETKIKNISC